MNEEDYLAGLLGGMPQDRLVTPEEPLPEIDIPYAEGTAPSDLLGRSQASIEVPPMDLAGRTVSTPVDAEFMRKERERARTALHNEAILETLGQTVDPLGYTAENIFGDEQSLERYLVEFADVPLAGVKGLVKGILSGSVSLAAIPFKTKAARNKMMKAIDEADLTFVLNEMNPMQEARALNEYFKRDPLVLESFDPADVNKIIPRSGISNVPAEGSHRTFINEAVNIAGQEKGLEQVPRIYSSDIKVGGTPAFGPDRHKMMVGDESRLADFRYITDNEEALRLLVGGNPQWFPQRAGSSVNLADLSKSDMRDLKGLKDLQGVNTSLQEYLDAKYKIPLMRGRPEVDDYLDQAMFQSAGGPNLSEKDLMQFVDFGDVPPFSQVRRFEGDDISLSRYWEDELASMLGGDPGSRMYEVVETQYRDPAEAMGRLRQSLDYNRSPIQRFMIEKILSGDVTPIDKFKGASYYRPTWRRELDQYYLDAEREAMEKAGVPDPYRQEDLWLEEKRLKENRARDLRSEQDLRIRNEGLF